MHLNHTWSRATRPAQMLAMLVTTALVILGITSLPTFAAAPTLKLAINADEDSYLSGVEQRYVVEFSCASTTEDCLDSVVTISLPHTIDHRPHCWSGSPEAAFPQPPKVFTSAPYTSGGASWQPCSCVVVVS